MGLRSFGARTAKMKRSLKAHSSSDISSRAKLISIADTSLDHDQATMRVSFINTT